jgi:hypothetical protein
MTCPRYSTCPGDCGHVRYFWTYSEASREHSRLLELLGWRAFSAIWDENVYAGPKRDVVYERLHESQRAA